MSQRDVIFQCRIVAAELRCTNSDMKIGGGLVEIAAEFSAAESDLLVLRLIDALVFLGI